MAKVINFKKHCNEEILKEIGKSINNGELVIFPTETVYGIGADGLNKNAINSIYEAKGRKNDNPLILHVNSIEMVLRIARDISELEYKLMNDLWPGPLTIILNKRKIVPYEATGYLETVGVRMPSNIIARKLIEYANTPIAAPSANISGRPSGTNIDDIVDELGNKVSYIIDGGNTLIGVESTVVKVINNKIYILRPGFITKEMLEKYGEVVIDKHVLLDVTDSDQILSPGMKYKHYAPNTKCVLVYSKDNNKMISKMKELENSNSLVITSEKNKHLFKNSISYGNTLEEISHNIFTILRSVDKHNYDIVIIEGVECTGLGLAIMNRLIRACSYNYILIK